MHLVLLPGMDGSAGLSRRFRQCLGPDVTSEVIEHRPTEMMGYDALERRVRDRLGDVRGRLVVLGESYSGPIAIRIGATPPPNLVGVILVSTFACPPAPPLLRFLVRSPMFRLRPPRWLIRKFMVGNDASADLVEEVRETIYGVRPAAVAHRLREVLAVDVRGPLRSITVPVLSLEGRRDALIRQRRLLPSPGLRREVVDAPHLLLQTQPERASRIVRDFLRTL